MSATITLRFAVPAGHSPGDYAMLHGNGGAGNINWSSPLSDRKIDLFPAGAGLFGFGRSSFGAGPFGKHSARGPVSGFGAVPFGKGCFGHGAVVITLTRRVEVCGTYKYALAGWDKPGNPHVGTPNEAELDVHITPPRPSGLKKISYDPDTDVLTLGVNE